MQVALDLPDASRAVFSLLAKPLSLYFEERVHELFRADHCSAREVAKGIEVLFMFEHID